MSRLRCVFHCHSHYSHDSNLSLERILQACQQNSLDVIALTDHNEIDGALQLQQMAPSNLKVIIGEEVSSKESHVIGLFLKEKIPAGMSIGDTIAAIRAQNGVVLLPHPFDSIRPGSAGLEVCLAVKDQIDFIEIFNARCLRARDNKAAVAFAEEYQLKPFVGADAHFYREYGNAICELAPFETQQEFMASLSEATFITRYAGFGVHAYSNYVRHIHRRLTDR